MAATADEFAERVLASALGAMEIYSIHIGDRLGFYRSLAGAGGMTSVELAESAGASERYVHEWLEQQATNGILEVEQSADTDRFSLPDAHAEVLADRRRRPRLR